MPIRTAALMACLLVIPMAAGIVEAAGTQDRSSTRQENSMHISIEIEGTTLAATLEDSEAARDFASLLPLTLTLKDYAATEKVSDLPRPLSTAGAPEGVTPRTGDLAYYAPWGNLAIYYKDFGYSKGLVKLGRLDSGVELMRQPGTFKATIRRARQP
ncbi:cyclophilin-like fold protein [Pseudomonas sp. KFB-139]|uniref:Cyclophilin-like fold protein n=1 Tax=Pseudomonas serbiensis TaxID=3064350 RepID=A0ABT9CXG3_9PSED|nr:cyclophilin-like fold protein [Pseudomonas sp. KFB-138]MDO7930192.1 cyclophilin-like fold protein [Pseudomonas sp. KFB-138]